MSINTQYHARKEKFQVRNQNYSKNPYFVQVIKSYHSYSIIIHFFLSKMLKEIWILVWLLKFYPRKSRFHVRLEWVNTEVCGAVGHKGHMPLMKKGHMGGILGNTKTSLFIAITKYVAPLLCVMLQKKNFFWGEQN